MSGAAAPARDVSVICPTYQEGEAIGQFLERVRAASATFRSARVRELIFVDDGSTDGTRETIRDAQRSWSSPRITLVERPRKDGTVSAQIAGFRAASHEVGITMDADGQHPPEAIEALVRAWEPGVDLVVASRYVPGGDVKWGDARRALISRGARILARVMLPGPRRVGDPLSGFFATRTSWVRSLEPMSLHYKLLLYVLAMHPGASIREVPYEMNLRVAGASKLVEGPRFIPSFLFELWKYRRAAEDSLRA